MNNLYRSVIFFCATVALTTQHSVASERTTCLYSERAVELLRDAISRETAHGQGLVPAYAESLGVFLEAGFPPEALISCLTARQPHWWSATRATGAAGESRSCFRPTWTSCPPTRLAATPLSCR